jgi:hypothetical protein
MYVITIPIPDETVLAEARPDHIHMYIDNPDILNVTLMELKELYGNKVEAEEVHERRWECQRCGYKAWAPVVF